MSIPRPLLLSLLIFLCVAPVAAQSSSMAAPSEAKLQSAEPVADIFHFQLADGEELNAPPLRIVENKIENKNDSPVIHGLDSRTQHLLTLEQNDSTCYLIRAYRVARVSPESDTTRPAGYSTCVRSSRIQLRTAVDLREIDSREIDSQKTDLQKTDLQKTDSQETDSRRAPR